MYELVAGCEHEGKCLTENAQCKERESRCNEDDKGYPKGQKCSFDYCRKTALAEKADGFNFGFQNTIANCYICTKSNVENIKPYENEGEIFGVYKRKGRYKNKNIVVISNNETYNLC